jgi:hypothetical protein
MNSPVTGRPQRVRILAAQPATHSTGLVRLLRFAYLVAIAITVLGLLYLFTLETRYKFGIFVAAGTTALFLFIWIGQGFRQLYEPLLRQRQQELAEKLVRGETLSVRGTPGVFVPLMLSLIALLFVLPNDIATTLSGRLWLLLGIGLLAVFWYWIVPRLRAPVLELDRTGLRTKQLGHVSWADIERAQLRVNGSIDHSFIAGHVLQLDFVIDRHPRPARGLRRWAQQFFRGMREWEARIPLRNPSENPLVILNLVTFFVRITARYQEKRQIAAAEKSAFAASSAHATSTTRREKLPTTPRRIVRQHLIHRTASYRPRQSLVLAVLISIFVLCFYGLRTNFFGSEAWMRVSMIVCGVFAALPSWYVGRFMMFGAVDNPDFTSPFVRALVAWILIPVMIYFLCWSIFGSALPDILTRTMGARFRETHALRKEFSFDRRECDYRIFGPPFDRGNWKSHFCSWPGEYDPLPDKGPMTIRGRKTWLGRHIDSVEPASPP